MLGKCLFWPTFGFYRHKNNKGFVLHLKLSEKGVFQYCKGASLWAPERSGSFPFCQWTVTAFVSNYTGELSNVILRCDEL